MIVRAGLGLVVAYVLLVVLAWVFQERIAFPAPRGEPPDPKRVGYTTGERIELLMARGTRLVGWYLPPRTPPPPPPPRRLPFSGPAWFHRHGANIAASSPGPAAH